MTTADVVLVDGRRRGDPPMCTYSRCMGGRGSPHTSPYSQRGGAALNSDDTARSQSLRLP